MISGTFKRSQINNDMYRPYCQACNENLSAINYVRKGVVYFRKLCTHCIRKKSKIKPVPPAWVKSGYKKKLVCERCSFIAKNPYQIFVYYIDGNLKNNNWTNLRSVCANCRIELNNSKTTWRESPLIADY